MLRPLSYLTIVAILLLILTTAFILSSTLPSDAISVLSPFIHAVIPESFHATVSATKIDTSPLLHNETTYNATSNEPSVLTPSPFAYVFYATSDSYACSILVNIHRLQHILHVAHPIHVLASFEVTEAYTSALRLSGATLHIQPVPPLAEGASGYYRDCLLKLLSFKMHILSPGLQRVLALDGDQLVMQNLDSLFSGLPPADLAAPRAYWLAKDFLASTFMVIALSDRLWYTVEEALNQTAFDKFDMDLINDLLGDTVLMLGGEYVTLNSHWEDWNLPRWYHPTLSINMTTVRLINELAKPDFGSRVKREEHEDGLISDDPPPYGEFPASLNYIPPPPGRPQATKAGHRLHQSHLSQQASSTASSTPTNLGIHPITTPFSIPPQPNILLPPAMPPPPPPPPPEPVPRFPKTHPMTTELFRLQSAAAVIHFTALGKPWSHTADTIAHIRGDAHPVLAEQFDIWRKTAKEVCPGGGAGVLMGEGD